MQTRGRQGLQWMEAQAVRPFSLSLSLSPTHSLPLSFAATTISTLVLLCHHYQWNPPKAMRPFSLSLSLSLSPTPLPLSFAATTISGALSVKPTKVKIKMSRSLKENTISAKGREIFYTYCLCLDYGLPRVACGHALGVHSPTELCATPCIRLGTGTTLLPRRCP